MKKHLIKNGLIFVFASIVCLISLEFSLRTIGFNVDRYNNPYPGGFPLYETWLNEHGVFNSLGYRDYEFARIKPKGKFRILAVGDSQTFGIGINKLEDTFVKRLESYLNADLEDRPFEVLNTAWAFGGDSDYMLYDLYERGYPLNPDMIMLFYTMTDIRYPHISCPSNSGNLPKYFPATDRWLHKHLLIYQVLKVRLEKWAKAYSHEIDVKPDYFDCLKTYYNSRAWDVNKIYLDIISMTNRIKKIPFVMVTIPMMFNLEKDYFFSEELDKLNNYCTDRKIDCIDLFKEGLKGQKTKDLTVSKDINRHFNEKGADFAAKIIFQKLKVLKDIWSSAFLTKVFSFKEINGDITTFMDMTRKLNRQQNKKFSINANLSYPHDNTGLKVNIWSDSEELHFKKTKWKLRKDRNLYTTHIVLDKNGTFKQSRKTYYSPNHETPTTIQKITRRDDAYIEEIKNIGDNASIINSNKRTYLFKENFSKRGNSRFKELEIQQGVIFPDPQVLEYKISEHSGPKYEKYLTETLLLYDMGLFHKISWKNYAKKLSRSILKKKPSLASVKAVSNYFNSIGEPTPSK